MFSLISSANNSLNLFSPDNSASQTSSQGSFAGRSVVKVDTSCPETILRAGGCDGELIILIALVAATALIPITLGISVGIYSSSLRMGCLASMMGSAVCLVALKIFEHLTRGEKKIGQITEVQLDSKDSRFYIIKLIIENRECEIGYFSKSGLIRPQNLIGRNITVHVKLSQKQKENPNAKATAFLFKDSLEAALAEAK